MNQIEEARKCLQIILKKGDVYDAIAQKKNVKPRSHFFITTNILLFSRIAYLAVLLFDKVNTFFAPIEEVKKAQDTIREILGVEVDVIQSNKTLNTRNFKIFQKKSIMILYEERRTKVEEYVENLKKILNFCELHNINSILLNYEDIQNSFVDVDLEGYSYNTRGYLLGGYYNEEMKDFLLLLNRQQLSCLIQQLETKKIDTKVIIRLGHQIEDVTIKNAIHQFLSEGNLEQLKEVVLERLTLNINSENSYKDRDGKVFETVQIKDEFVQTIVSDKQGNQLSSTVLTIYEYFNLIDYQALLEQIKMQCDNKETLLMVALYLYLYQNKKVDFKNIKSSNSFYDRVYQSYHDKKRNGKIKGLYTKGFKWWKNLISACFAIYLTLILLLVPLITGASLDLVQKLAFRNPDSSILQNIVEYIFKPYAKSFELEKVLFNQATTDLQNIDFSKLAGLTGDSFSGDKEGNVVAIITKLSEDFEMPSYYACGYAESGTYRFGQMQYDMVEPIFSVEKFQDVKPALEIEYPISRQELRNMIRNGKITFLKTIYPVGGSYILTAIYIRDAEDYQKELTINSGWSDNTLLQSEIELLESMKKPEIHFMYGVDETLENTFVEFASKEGEYTSLLPDEIREIITTGLGLNPDATIPQIYEAIKSKEYSKTPLQEAGLGFQIKFMGEKRYFETISSLDSLICNLAATLAVEVNDELIYIEGYLNVNQDEYITTGEAHAWALSQMGDIIEVTPTNEKETEEEQDVIAKIIAWCIKHDIPKYAILLILLEVSYKIFGKKMVWNIQVRKLEKLLSSPNIEKSYTKITETLYGGMNIPFQMDPCELMTKIEEELSAFSIEELKQLKKEIQKSNIETDEIGKKAGRLLDEVPFIRKNSKQLQKTLKRKR